jgi:hypothetical protein
MQEQEYKVFENKWIPYTCANCLLEIIDTNYFIYFCDINYALKMWLIFTFCVRSPINELRVLFLFFAEKKLDNKTCESNKLAKVQTIVLTALEHRTQAGV